jgi:hypothetical protein
VSQRQQNIVVLLVALLTGTLALGAMALPPFPILGWFISAPTVPPFESWWYSLPDPHRTKWLYDVGITLATAFYHLVIALMFWLLSRPLRLGAPHRVRWLVGFTVVLAVASIVWFLLNWRYGLKYQGMSAMLGYLVISAIWVAIVLVGLWFVNRSGSWWAHLALEFLAFAWVVTFAFPWLGEMI